MSKDCLFCRIVNKEITADIVFEDEKILAFRDISPQAPTHVLVITKEHISTLNDIEDKSIYIDIFNAIDKITMSENIKDSGYRVCVNCNNEGGQLVYHLHFHILGGKQLKGQLG